LFLRCLGAVVVAAFLSLLVQHDVLFGVRGLLPACPVPEGAGPTLLQLRCTDGMLRLAALAGIASGLGLMAGLAPRWCLVAAWTLYLSLVNVGGAFLGFQWDNLLLETLLLSLFVAPGGWRPRGRPSPHPAAVFLLQWLLFRLHAESGAAKLLLGDPTWWDLTAMAGYYETAPLPTWVGWWAHQMPGWAHRATSALTLVVELIVPFGIWGPRRIRRVAVAIMAVLQVGVILTANYGFFNYLTLALCLWALDDQDLGASPAPPRVVHRRTTWTMGAVAVVLVALSIVPFLRLVPPLRSVAVALSPFAQTLDDVRSFNAYHLFAQMTHVRDEIVIEGSDDGGTTWREYDFRWKPGPVDRAPTFVAPHQPRADFQAWFLPLGGDSLWFDTLLRRLLEEPSAVASLWAHDPFDGRAPGAVRVAVYRYRFTDRATRTATGAWWTRSLTRTSRVMRASGARP
jgi:hypothetical protein